MVMDSVYLQVDAIDVTNDENVGTALEENICVSKVASKIESSIDNLKLARKCKISPKKSVKTMRKTTQNGIKLSSIHFYLVHLE